MEMNQLYGNAWARDSGGRIIHNAQGVPTRAAEQQNFGSSLPKWIGGITNSFNIRGVSVSALVDFKLGHKLNSGTYTNAVRHGNDVSTLPGRDVGCVVGEGVNQQGEINTVCTPVQQYYEAIRTYSMSEQSIFNAGLLEPSPDHGRLRPHAAPRRRLRRPAGQGEPGGEQRAPPEEVGAARPSRAERHLRRQPDGSGIHRRAGDARTRAQCQRTLLRTTHDFFEISYEDEY
jgi:hypothetical protein